MFTFGRDKDSFKDVNVDKWDVHEDQLPSAPEPIRVDAPEFATKEQDFGAIMRQYPFGTDQATVLNIEDISGLDVAVSAVLAEYMQHDDEKSEQSGQSVQSAAGSNEVTAVTDHDGGHGNAHADGAASQAKVRIFSGAELAEIDAQTVANGGVVPSMADVDAADIASAQAAQAQRDVFDLTEVYSRPVPDMDKDPMAFLDYLRREGGFAGISQRYSWPQQMQDRYDNRPFSDHSERKEEEKRGAEMAAEIQKRLDQEKAEEANAQQQAENAAKEAAEAEKLLIASQQEIEKLKAENGALRGNWFDRNIVTPALAVTDIPLMPLKDAFMYAANPIPMILWMAATATAMFMTPGLGEIMAADPTIALGVTVYGASIAKRMTGKLKNIFNSEETPDQYKFLPNAARNRHYREAKAKIEAFEATDAKVIAEGDIMVKTDGGEGDAVVLEDATVIVAPASKDASAAEEKPAGGSALTSGEALGLIAELAHSTAAAEASKPKSGLAPVSKKPRPRVFKASQL